jgi:pimeloyl-ACP methyl ester carboxylesterase
MRVLLRFVSALLACVALVAHADDAGPAQREFQFPADFVGKIRVPVLMLAGTADTYKGCCTIEMARTLADAAKKNPDIAPLFVLREYEGAGHGFNMNTSHQRALVSDSRDRAIAQLTQYLPDR